MDKVIKDNDLLAIESDLATNTEVFRLRKEYRRRKEEERKNLGHPDTPEQ